MENVVLESLKNRRSVRKYSDKMVEQEQLDAIMEAATYAPTGMGKQSPTVVVVKTKQTRDLISKLNAKVMNREGVDSFYGAPVVAIVFGNPEVPTWFDDAVLVAGNMMNAAYAVGVDSCYIYRAKEEFAFDEGKALMKEWGVNENCVGVANIILGYGEGDAPIAKARKEGYVIEV